MASTGPVWEPSGTSAPSRGRHKIHKKRPVRGSSAFLGVAAVGAIAAGGAAGADTGDISLSSADKRQSQPDRVPGGGLGLTTMVAAGDKLENQLTAQGEQQAADAEAEAKRVAAEKARIAEEKRQAAEEAARKKAAEEAARKKAEEEREKREAKERAEREAERKRLAAMWKMPTSNYRISAGYGQSGSNWSNLHTGLDFAAPTGTPAYAIHGGTVTEAGWAGSYGYRIVLTLDDGTEIWYCHLSSMTVSSGEVVAGQQIGRVGSTGNSTGPHLHLEVHPGGGDAVDPASWLRATGLPV